MAAKTRPWSDLNTRLRLKLTKSYTFSLNAMFATYAYEMDENGRVFVGDRTEWSYGRFGRFQGMSQSLSYTLDNSKIKKLFSRKKATDNSLGGNEDEDDEDEDEEETDPEMQNVDPDRKKGRQSTATNKSNAVDEDGYLKFSLPWHFTVSYGVSMRENTSAKINEKRMRYPYKLTHTPNFSGSIRIAKGWEANFNSGYDFNYHKLSMTTASLGRDLHCFTMTCSVVLMPYTSYNFTFQANSSMLADALRWKKQSSYSSNIDWY